MAEDEIQNHNRISAGIQHGIYTHNLI